MGRFLLFCRLVAVETCNKGQLSSSGIIVQPLFSWFDTCLNKSDWSRIMFPFLAIENVVHVLKENRASEEVKLSMLCLFVCYYILRFCKTCIFFFSQCETEGQ